MKSILNFWPIVCRFVRIQETKEPLFKLLHLNLKKISTSLILGFNISTKQDFIFDSLGPRVMRLDSSMDVGKEWRDGAAVLLQQHLVTLSSPLDKCGLSGQPRRQSATTARPRGD
jgi:hypothetical protein